jgi:hypothetical protein
MFIQGWKSLMRPVSFAGFAAFVALGMAHAQSTAIPSQPASASAVPASASAAPSESSSQQNWSSSLQSYSVDSSDGSAALPSSPEPSGSGAGGQAETTNKGFKNNLANNYALEFGGGFSGPLGSSSSAITWGGNFTVGGGWNFNKHLALLAEYQFIDDKLPGPIIAETGASGGDAHIWSLTFAPVVDLFPKSKNDIYITGGGGFYRKLTSFTDPEEEEYCDYYCEVGVVNAVVGHFSSNQGGWNVGGGYERRLGGMYNDSRTKLFAEVRYLDIYTPIEEGVSPSGLPAVGIAAGTKLIPITFGVRF